MKKTPTKPYTITRTKPPPRPPLKLDGMAIGEDGPTGLFQITLAADLGQTELLVETLLDIQRGADALEVVDALRAMAASIEKAAFEYASAPGTPAAPVPVKAKPKAKPRAK
jgi:hypothetical protein